MADIELVVKIPEESYKFAKECKSKGSSRYSWNLSHDNIILIIANGIPLPKEHIAVNKLDALDLIVEAEKKCKRLGRNTI